MTFYPPPNRLPERLITSDFLLQPLTPEHVRIDYDAVMGSRQMLNLWSGSTWPTPDFTLADNLADLQWHDNEHQQRIAFTYTILDPTGTKCLGCLYIRPVAELAKDNPHKLTHISAAAALARFWVISSNITERLDLKVLNALIAWFDRTWDFSEFYFHTREANKEQITLFETAQLTHRFDLNLPHRGGIHQFYQP